MGIGNLITATRVKWGLKIIKRSERNVSLTCALFLAVVVGLRLKSKHGIFKLLAIVLKDKH